MAWFKNNPDLSQDKLSLPLEINDGRWSRIHSHILLVVSFLVTMLIILAMFAPIHEIVLAKGQIIPVGDVVETQHLEGGIVGKVKVREGDLVKSGDVLMKLSGLDVDTELKQTSAKLGTLDIERLRISSLIDGKSPDFAEYSKRNSSAVRDQTALYNAEHNAYLAEIRTAELRISQRKSELVTTRTELGKHEAELELRNERHDVLKKLLTKGLTTKQAYLEAQLSLKENELRYERTAGSLDVAERKVSEAESMLENIRATKRSEWIEALSEVEENITALQEQSHNLKSKVSRQEIVAPVTGVVQSLAAKNAGEVIKPGEVVARIVPISREIEVEVNVPPEHIGHIQIGSQARILLTAYDNETYGYANGNISILSPTTSQNEEGDYFYTAKLSLDRQSLEFGEIVKPILPGMIAHAEIYTGTKSLMRYMLKPVYRSLGKAFSER